MSDFLKAVNLKKRYSSKWALRGVDLNIEKGRIVGLLGHNGSGKSTLLKIIAGLLKPTEGEVLIDGKRPGLATKGIVSFMPEGSHLYKWMRIKDAISFYREMFDDFNGDKAEDYLKLMALNPEDKITSLSRGMMERLKLLLVLSRNAEIYLLDEPLSGIDPLSRDKIITGILEGYREGESSIIISTHMVSEIEKIFDEVIFLDHGEVMMSGNADEMRDQRGKSIEDIFKEVLQ
ncbi:ABC transporter ATP-binding protein [Calorimonas adulescens]|jgi:ABC transporter.|uniref:ABC transporter ATP-binding protein n=1 Tax=Calorimonas adulescens TaxID=2606906 RepID=A0A5D8QDG8_9THEO|nr:ABC transporter ATP-binding protein [Calorimonas adulescens]TZE82572.1 ABC transporter ATP-binding protein [Calorimonas adulescens]